MGAGGRSASNPGRFMAGPANRNPRRYWGWRVFGQALLSFPTPPSGAGVHEETTTFRYEVRFL